MYPLASSKDVFAILSSFSLFTGYNSCSSGGFLEDVDEFGAGRFHFVDGLIDLRIQKIMPHIGQEADDEARCRRDHLRVDTSCDLRRGEFTGGIDVIEQLQHAYDGAQETEHGGDAVYQGQDRQVAFHLIDLQFAYVFHALFDRIDGFADALKAFVDHAGHGVGGVFGQWPCRCHITGIDIVFYDVHEVGVDLAGLADRDNINS